MSHAMNNHTPAYPQPEPLLLDVRAAARLLGVSPRTLFTLTRQGLPHVRIGRRVFYPLDKLREWVARKTQTNENR